MALFQKIVAFFIGLGFTATAATAIATYAMSTGEMPWGSGDPGSAPVTASGSVPEIDPAGMTSLACLLIGGTLLMVGRKRKAAAAAAAA